MVTRLAPELNGIERAGLAEFFLICWDLMRFAKEQGIPAQGRGSATSSRPSAPQPTTRNLRGGSSGIDQLPCGLGGPAGHAAPARVRVAYPGLWLADGVYATSTDHDRTDRHRTHGTGPVTIGDGVFIGAGSAIGPGAVIRPGARLDAESRVYPMEVVGP